LAASLNRVQLIGNVGKDPEIRRTQDGRPVANFSVATSESWRDKNSGEKKEITDWHNIVCFNEKLCEVIEKYVRKGSKIYVEGAQKTRKWQDQQGNDRYSTEVVLQAFNGTIVLLDGKDSSGFKKADSPDDYGSESKPNGQSAPAGGNSMTGSGKAFDDEIPF
jgi:single-strand DNA-binding protein